MDNKVRLSITLKRNQFERLQAISNNTGVSISRLCENLILYFNDSDADNKLTILSTKEVVEVNQIKKTTLSISKNTKEIYKSLKQMNLIPKLVMYFLSFTEQEQRRFLIYHL